MFGSQTIDRIIKENGKGEYIFYLTVWYHNSDYFVKSESTSKRDWVVVRPPIGFSFCVLARYDGQSTITRFVNFDLLGEVVVPLTYKEFLDKDKSVKIYLSFTNQDTKENAAVFGNSSVGRPSKKLNYHFDLFKEAIEVIFYEDRVSEVLYRNREKVIQMESISVRDDEDAIKVLTALFEGYWEQFSEDVFAGFYTAEMLIALMNTAITSFKEKFYTKLLDLQMRAFLNWAEIMGIKQSNGYYPVPLVLPLWIVKFSKGSARDDKRKKAIVGLMPDLEILQVASEQSRIGDEEGNNKHYSLLAWFWVNFSVLREALLKVADISKRIRWRGDLKNYLFTFLKQLQPFAFKVDLSSLGKVKPNYFAIRCYSPLDEGFSKSKKCGKGLVMYRVSELKNYSKYLPMFESIDSVLSLFVMEVPLLAKKVKSTENYVLVLNSNKLISSILISSLEFNQWGNCRYFWGARKLCTIGSVYPFVLKGREYLEALKSFDELSKKYFSFILSDRKLMFVVSI
jgi:hypothetical protein